MAYSRNIHDKARRLKLQGLSYEKIAELPDMPKRYQTIIKWAKEENWDEEFRVIEQKANEKRIEKEADKIAKMNDKHLKILEATFGKIVSKLKSEDLQFNSLRDLIYSLDKVITAERLIHGEVTERKEENVNGKLEHSHNVNIKQLSDAELDRFIAGKLEELR